MSAVLSPREAELLAQVQVRDGRLEELARENALLRQKVDALVRRLFGARSERLDPGQLLLLLQGTEAPVLSPPAPPPRASAGARPPRPRRRARLPEHLPVVEEVLDPEAVRACPGAWRRVGEEVSESLDYEPGRFFRRRLVRPKYVSRRGGGVGEASAFLIAPLPAGLLERGLAAPGLLAHVLVSKYGDHLPLYRQEQIYRHRHGVRLPRATLARWVELAADWLRPVCEAMRRDVLAGGYVQVDETPVRYLCPGLGRAAQGYLWTCARPGGDVIFDWRTGRGASCLERIVPAGFAGVVQCDGFAAYPSFVARRSPHAGTITLAGCWAHVRRKFHEAQEQAPRLVGWLLGQIGQLYRAEARLRAARAGPRLRAATRAAESRAVVVRLHRALVVLKARRFLPRSLLGRAIDYALGQWSTLGVFLADGRVEIDNNGVENAIRPTAVGKKNWLFVGGADTGQRSAVIYSVIESCRRRGVEPYAYLRDVLTRLPAMTNWTVGALTPAAWAKAHPRPRRGRPGPAS